MVYCFDLDGTLYNTDGNNYSDSSPKKSRIEFVNKIFGEGHTIMIDTAKGYASGKNYFFFNVNQLKSWGVKFNNFRKGTKIGADIFIEYKGIQDKRFFQD